MRHKLYMLRCGLRLSQEEMGKKIGVSRATYAFVESGKRKGTVAFWEGFQKAFDVPITELPKYMKKERESNETETQSSS